MFICIYLKVRRLVGTCYTNVTVALYQTSRHAVLCVCSVLAAKESFGGMRLLRRADFNAGANINTFWRMPCRGALDTGSKKALTWDNKHITWFGKCQESDIQSGE